MKNNKPSIPRFELEYWIDEKKGKTEKWEGSVCEIYKYKENETYYFRYYAGEVSSFGDIPISDFIALKLCKGQRVPEFEILEQLPIDKEPISKIILLANITITDGMMHFYNGNRQFKSWAENFKSMRLIEPKADKISDVNELLRDKQERIELLDEREFELKTARDRIKELEDKLRAKDIQEFEEELVEARKRIKELETLYASEQEETIIYTTMVDTRNKWIRELEEELAEVRNQLQEVPIEILKIRNHYEEEIKTAQDRIKKLESEFAIAQQIITSKQQVIDIIKKKRITKIK